MKPLFLAVFVVSVALGLLAGSAFAVEGPSNNQELLAKIEALQKQLTQLRERVGQVQAGIPGGTPGTVPGSVAPSTPIPAFGEIIGLFDEDHEDDEIVQLNNVRIESVASNPDTAGVSIITASYDIGIGCRKFIDLDAVSGATVPCPMAPTRLYHIRVDADARLFLRNRARATIADFEVGNRINVYGFMDQSRFTLDALIVRNLDKPVVQKFVQLNNLEVVSVRQLQGFPPSLVVTAVHGGIFPCLDFGDGSGRGVSAPCPMGIRMEVGGVASATVAAPTPDMTPPDSEKPLFYPMPMRYEIAVGLDATVVDRDRNPMSANDIAVGDKINVYGTASAAGAGSIQAKIVRDLSKPALPAARGSLRVLVVDGSVACTLVWQGPDAAPCGGIDGASVALYALGSSNGSPVRAAPMAPVVFENLPAGEYTIVAGAPGFASQKRNVKFAGGPEQVVTILLSRDGGGSSAERITVSTPDSLEGVAGRPFSATFTAIGGSGLSYRWELTEGRLPPGLSLSSFATQIHCFTTPCNPIQQAKVAGVPTVAGDYKFTLRVAASGSPDAVGEETVVIAVRSQ